jgi:hypothetical protein
LDTLGLLSDRGSSRPILALDTAARDSSRPIAAFETAYVSALGSSRPIPKVLNKENFSKTTLFLQSQGKQNFNKVSNGQRRFFSDLPVCEFFNPGLDIANLVSHLYTGSNHHQRNNLQGLM